MKDSQMSEQSLELHSPKPLSRRENSVLSGVNINSLLEKAIDSKSAVEVLKELRVMELDYHARNAKQEFDEAMRSFKSDCPVITKDKGVPDRNGKVAYKYCPLEVIEVQIRPFEEKHGFYHTFDTDTSAPDGWVIQKCIVNHVGGHCSASVGKFRLGTKTGIMSDTQVDAAAQSFANRYALKNAYGLVLSGEDIDMNTGKIKPQGPSAIQPTETSLKDLAAELWAVLAPVRGTLKNWDASNQWLWREEILDAAADEKAPNLSAKRFADVITKSKERLAR